MRCGGEHSKPLRGACKVFFREDEFYLAFGEKKSILRTKNKSGSAFGRLLDRDENAFRKKYERFSFYS
jgi:hypothetical protein